MYPMSVHLPAGKTRFQGFTRPSHHEELLTAHRDGSQTMERPHSPRGETGINQLPLPVVFASPASLFCLSLPCSTDIYIHNVCRSSNCSLGRDIWFDVAGICPFDREPAQLYGTVLVLHKRPYLIRAHKHCHKAVVVNVNNRKE